MCVISLDICTIPLGEVIPILYGKTIQLLKTAMKLRVCVCVCVYLTSVDVSDAIDPINRTG